MDLNNKKKKIEVIEKVWKIVILYKFPIMYLIMFSKKVL